MVVINIISLKETKSQNKNSEETEILTEVITDVTENIQNKDSEENLPNDSGSESIELKPLVTDKIK